VDWAIGNVRAPEFPENDEEDGYYVGDIKGDGRQGQNGKEGGGRPDVDE